MEETDPPTPTPIPAPSKAAQIVAKIEDYLAGSSDLSTASYTITSANGGTRQLSRCTHSELLALLRYWRGILANETIAATTRHRPTIRFRY